MRRAIARGQIVPKSGAISGDTPICVLKVHALFDVRRGGLGMNARWNNIVRVAREVEDALAKGGQPEGSAIMRLARGVLDFQQQLVGSSVVRPALSAGHRALGARMLPPPR